MSQPEQSVIFETDRLFFKKMTIDDVSNLQQIFSDPVAMRYYPKTFDENETKVWIQCVLNNYAKHHAGLWTCHLKSTGEFVGQCGLHFHPGLDGQDSSTCSINIYVCPTSTHHFLLKN